VKIRSRLAAAEAAKLMAAQVTQDDERDLELQIKDENIQVS